MRRFRTVAFLALFLLGAHLSYGDAKAPGGHDSPDPELTQFEKCPLYPTSKDIFLANTDSHAREMSALTDLVSPYVAESPRSWAITRNNFIDDWIFGKMESDQIPYTGLSSDAEFIRRVYLDTTGRIPSVQAVQSFLQNPDPNKRSALIDQLLSGNEFKDRMTLWVGDLVRNTAAVLFPTGRTTYYQYLKDAMSRNVPYNQLVHDLITGKGDNYTVGPANFITREWMGGPIQDTYDNLAVAVSKEFLGVPLICVTCHNGAYHLESINLYLSNKTRRQLWGMSAFFSGVKFQRTPLGPNEYKYNISDGRSAGYDTRARGGIRPPRAVADGESPVVPPAYFFTGETPASDNYREELARMVLNDDQFARSTVNRLWQEFMGIGIVDPVDGFDLARQDPTRPPASPWTVQPSHPELLGLLAREFQSSNYDLSHMISLILKSSAYQLSSRFDGTWDDRYTRYFARHLVRRLSAEQFHDAIAVATQLPGNYTITGFSSPVMWAMQLPDPTEPQSDRNVLSLLNVFQRGDRNISERPPLASGSIFQALNLMNNGFVTQRVRVSTRNSFVQQLRAMGYTNDQIVDQLFLATLSRYPTDQEHTYAVSLLVDGTNARLEDLAWVLINKLEFMFY